MNIEALNKINNSSIYPQNVTNMNNQIMIIQENVFSKKNELKLSSPCLLLSGIII